MNLILNTDSYKAAHYLIQAPKQTKNFSYIESRGGKDKETVFFGLQYICKKYLTKQIKQKHIKKAEKFFTAHGLPFNKKGSVTFSYCLDSLTTLIASFPFIWLTGTASL